MSHNYQPGSHTNPPEELSVEHSELINGPDGRPRLRTAHDENLDFLLNLDPDYLAKIVDNIKTSRYNPRNTSTVDLVATSTAFSPLPYRPSAPQQNAAPKKNLKAMALYQVPQASMPLELPNQTHYRPSRMAMQQMGIVEPTLPEPDQKYQGNLLSQSYLAQHGDLPDHLNCALWIMNLPAWAREGDFFAQITQGAVRILSFCPPSTGHSHLAAKLVFMTEEGAIKFLQQASSNDGIHVLGNRIKAIYNRHGYMRYEYQDQSRVIHIEGPGHIMNFEYWHWYFTCWSVFSLEGFVYLPCDRSDRVRMEFRFARIDGQALTCLNAVTKNPEFSGLVTAWYGPDPCKPQTS